MWITCAVLAIAGLDIAVLCAVRANANERERWSGPLSMGYSACAPEQKPLRDAIVRFADFNHGFPHAVGDLQALDYDGNRWIDARVPIVDEFGRRLDLRVEETRLGERCSAWSLGPDKRHDGDDVRLWSVDVSFGELCVAVPSTR